MVHAALQELRMQSVQHVEEVLPRRSLVLRVLVREVLGEVRVLLHLRVDLLDGELIVMWHLDEGHLRFQQQVLLAAKDLLKKVLVDYGLVREIHLKAAKQKLE